MSKLISIIIPTLNKEKCLIKCIDSIKRNSNKRKIEIVVVDDFSKDRRYEKLKNKHPDVRLIIHKKNLGFGRSCNDGIKIAKGEYIIILNDDTVVTKNWLEGLIKPLSNKLIGITTGKILFLKKKGKNKIIWYAGGKLTQLFPKIVWHIGYKEVDKKQYDEIKEIEFISGCVMAFRKQFINKVGYFDENYFLYYEDADLCLRARKIGYKLIYNPKSVIFHSESLSTKRESPFWIYHRERSRFIFVKKNAPYLLPLFFIYYLFVYFPESIFFAIKNKDLEIIRKSIAGFINGILNNNQGELNT